MRLGAYNCQITKGSKADSAYHESLIQERHRHRWELNNEYRSKLQKAGLVISGVNPENDLVEIIELEDHPWFVEFVKKAIEYHESHQMS